MRIANKKPSRAEIPDRPFDKPAAIIAMIVLLMVLLLEGLGIASSGRDPEHYRDTPKSWINFLVNQPH